MTVARVFYRLEDPNLQAAITEAKKLWTRLCAKYLAKNGDQGSLVRGSGLSLMATAGRERKPRRKIILGQEQVTDAQHSLVWESSLDKVQAVFKKHGIEVDYLPGYID